MDYSTYFCCSINKNMAKSRKDKSRKENLEKFKEKVQTQKQQEKMASIPEQRPFRQVPSWNSEETFELHGNELEAIYNFLQIFAPAVNATQQVFARGVQAGKIKIGYEYEDGTPVSSEEIETYTKSLQDYFAARQKEEAAKEEPKSKIVSFTGEPVSETEA